MSEHSFPVRTLLFVSLAVNLLVVGGVVGAFASGARLQQPAAPVEAIEDQPRLPGALRFLAALPPEVRVRMRQELADGWRASRETRQAAVQARRDALDAAAAEPYDAARVRSAFAAMREADQAAIAVFHDEIADAFGVLSAEERRLAIEALRAAAPMRQRANGEGLAPGATPAPDGSFREKMRERRERRRERLQGQQQAPPADPQ